MQMAAAADGEVLFRCFTANGGTELVVLRTGDRLTVARSGETILQVRLEGQGETCKLNALERATQNGHEAQRALLAVLEALFSDEGSPETARLEGENWRDLIPGLIECGIALPGDAGPVVHAEMVWQLPDLWLPHPERQPYPQQFIMTGGKRHPRRRPKPNGLVYSRYIPWLGQTFSLRTVDIEADLAVFNRWMNDPRVVYFFEEAGDLDKHRAYLRGIDADPHMTTLFGCIDGAPFCYFEIYWAKENRLGPYYDADEYDRGWHVAVGEDGYRGRDYIATWLPSLMHYMFLDDPRTQRIAGEPRSDHAQQIRNLERSGFASIKEFDFPHKRAMLVMLLRERYFGERLWIPRAARPDAGAHSNGATAANQSPATTATGGLA